MTKVESVIYHGSWKCYEHNYATLSKTVGRQLISGLYLSLFYAYNNAIKTSPSTT